jgi:UPF0755 protein
MRRNPRRLFGRWLLILVLPPLTFVAWLAGYSLTDIQIQQFPLQFSIKHGSSLRSVARQLQSAGALNSPWQFEVLARIRQDETRIQAGNYEISGNSTPYALLQKITSGDHRTDRIKFIEGWTWAQMRTAIDAHPALKHETRGLADAELMARLEINHPSPEGLFFPDTYFFASGDSDSRILQRSYYVMQSHLATLWQTRAEKLPLDTPYQALILASIVEKETGRADERPLVAAVFINRLRIAMKLQTDPAVIYGIGAQFDGNLRKRDLLTDGPYNTYTRAGLPPTPIAMPGYAALQATLNPPQANALYFVARGDGTSVFSSTLAEHERAVTRYQRRGNR